MQNKELQFGVGVFILLGILGLLWLAFQVSGFTWENERDYYRVVAEFNNIGALKERAPIKISGVVIGHVVDIKLDPKTFRARVEMAIESKVNHIPVDSSAAIYTSGLLGASYIAVTPGFDNTFLQANGLIETTKSAVILENLIGQLMFNSKK